MGDFAMRLGNFPLVSAKSSPPGSIPALMPFIPGRPQASGNAKVTHHQFINLKPPDPRAPDCQFPDCNRSDSHGAHRQRAYRKCPRSLGPDRQRPKTRARRPFLR